MKHHSFISAGVGLCLIFSAGLTLAAEIQIAVTDNFTKAFQELQQKFEKTTSHQLTPTFNTSEKLYLQIKEGKPFDLFLTDTLQHSQRLEQEGYVAPESHVIYAHNKLALWSLQPYLVDSQGRILMASKFKKLAISTDVPYHLATQQTLKKLGIWDKLKSKMAKATTLSDTYQLIADQKADLGFIVLSQLANLDEKQSQWSLWVVPSHLYDPLQQHAVVLKQGKNLEVAQEFIGFLQRSIARSVLEDLGYEVPWQI